MKDKTRFLLFLLFITATALVSRRLTRQGSSKHYFAIQHDKDVYKKAKNDVVKKTQKTPRRNKNGLNQRQLKIMDFLANKTVASIKDIGKEFKGISERTLRRDLQDLVLQKFAAKKGSTKNAEYSIIK